MKVRICPDCGERWWCVKCGYCHLCHPDFEPPAGVAVKPRGGSPTLPSQAVNLCSCPVRSTEIGDGDMKAFKCGEKVPVSGIYKVLHLRPHNADQREMYFEGSRFPMCKVCAAGVHYRLESPYVPMAVPAVVELASAVC